MDVINGTACGNQCINSGKYCAVDPGHDLNTGISGADVARENLRQICIQRQVGQQKFLKYIMCIQDSCVKKSDLSSSCSQTCMIILIFEQIL
jgi:hypothetical protein